MSGKRPNALGIPVGGGRNTFVQTERKAHEAWADLSIRNPRASGVLHKLVAMMGHQNAVVIPQRTLAKVCGCSERTIRNALPDLISGNWIQIVQLGPAGSVNAYVVNSSVAWGEKRDNLHLSVFDARIIADRDDQPNKEAVDQPPELRRIPVLYPGERQLPAGDGLPPPSQPTLPGMEPDLPTRQPVPADHATNDRRTFPHRTFADHSE